MSGVRHGIDLTEGKVSAVLMKFAVPFVLANLVTCIYNAIGLLVVGKYTNPETIAAVATGAYVTNLSIAILTGIGTGITVLVGNRIGEKNNEEGRKAVGNALIIAVAVIVLLTLLTWAFR